ncbi:uncharacterized protein LOC118420146 [Branchiostoma floridae]|uniref:Uncharacterized protein LOC118420146 n=1 Tax=Branchiostoma floridae TaxID=7739 RepID=A0A9J7LH36_BRAFL|nr:uncharacterized protein LOC118420146 [Branchiostoma floridae]
MHAPSRMQTLIRKTYLFVLAMNSLDKGIPISVAPVKYADDLTNTELLMGSLPGQMQLAINEVDSWAKSYSMAANVKKTKDMVVSCRKEAVNPPPLTLNGENVERVRRFKLLGVIVSDDLSWGPHIEYMLSKVSPRIHYLRLSKRAGLPADVLLQIYKTFIRPVLEYGSPVWGGLPRGLAEELEKVQSPVAGSSVYPTNSYLPWSPGDGMRLYVN